MRIKVSLSVFLYKAEIEDVKQAKMQQSSKLGSCLNSFSSEIGEEKKKAQDLQTV